MGRYIVRRLLQAIPMLFLVSLVLFALVNIAPGGPLSGQGRSRRIRPEKAEILRRQFGLDKPLYLQYIIWLIGNDWMPVDADGDGLTESYGERRGILRGDFGFSFQTRRPVYEEIADRLPNTVYLMTVTLLVVGILAIPVGVISAIKQYSFFDISVTTFSFMGQALPEFWLGLVLFLIFYAWADNPFTGEALLPSGGIQTIGYSYTVWERLKILFLPILNGPAGWFPWYLAIWDLIKHLILPVTMGMVGWIAWYSRFLRSGMLDVIHKDYIRTARAKGLSERIVLYRHAFKNAVSPLVTIFALDLPYIFAGSLYVEYIFSWSGMGRLYYNSAVKRDYPVLMAILIISAGLMMLCNLLADIAYGILDPRVRYD